MALYKFCIIIIIIIIIIISSSSSSSSSIMYNTLQCTYVKICVVKVTVCDL